MYHDKAQRDFARTLRNEPTPAEKRLWHLLHAQNSVATNSAVRPRSAATLSTLFASQPNSSSNSMVRNIQSPKLLNTTEGAPIGSPCGDFIFFASATKNWMKIFMGSWTRS